MALNTNEFSKKNQKKHFLFIFFQINNFKEINFIKGVI